MNILHYFLGFPPYRSGGLTKYCVDLMQAQLKDENIVSALWPGQMKLANNKIRIKKRKTINGIQSFEIINPLPVSLDEGIKDFSFYMQSCNEYIYEEFLKELNPDVVHIHTLMGLHKEFIKVLQKLKIHSVYTTHDYFGICPKVTLYRFGDVCNDDNECKNCIQCNLDALSIKKIFLIQSPMYRRAKNSAVVSFIRKKHRARFFLSKTTPMLPTNCNVHFLAKNYTILRNYYIGMIKMVNVIHFNSTLTKEIYTRYFHPMRYRVINISHCGIQDNRTSITWIPDNVLRITYLSPTKPFKGYDVLKAALDEIWKSGNHNFILNLFNDVPTESPYMRIQKNGFTQSQLFSIFSKTDVLVAPSIWYETFGFTVLEALSYGVPVVVSNHVGAKDIIGNCGIIVEAGNVNELKNALESLTIKQIKLYRENIKNYLQIKTWNTFVKENYVLYHLC